MRLPATLILSILLYCLFYKAYSQRGYVDYFKNFTAEDGLPANTVYSICEDNDGFIWIGTSDGLCRFDGYNFKIYRDLSMNLTHNRKDFFRKIYRSKNGDLWIGMEFGFISLDEKTGRFNRHFKTDPSITRKNFLQCTILPYTELNNGSIVASNSSHENLIINPQTKTVSYLFAETSTLFSAIVIAYDQNRLALIKEGDIYVYNMQNQTSQLILHTDLHPLIYPDGGCFKNDFLFLTEENRIIKIDVKKRSVVKDVEISQEYHVIEPVSRINLAPNGNLVFFTKGYGVYFLDENLNILDHYTGNRNVRFGLQSNIIESIYFDSGRNLWIGTDLGGISCLPYNNRFSSSIYEHLKGKFISSFYRKNNMLYAGVYNEGLYQMDLKNKITNPVPLSLQPRNIRSISEMKGHLLLGSEKGLIDYDPETGVDKTILFDEGNEEIFRYLFKENDSTLYVATNIRIYQLIFRNSGLEKKELVVENFSMISKGYKNEFVYCGRNKVNNPGYIRLSPTLIKLNNQLILEGCTRVVKYQNTMWVAETNGLLRLNDQYVPVDTFNYKNSPLKTRIMSMELSGDNIWISCDNHLFRFNIPTTSFCEFDIFDGLTNIEFVSNSSYADEEGYLYFGSIDGFIRFHPDSIQLKTYTPKPVVTKVKIFNEEFAESNKKFIDKLNLTYEQNTLFIEFSSPQPVFQDKIEYAYQLGNNGKWIYIGNTHSFWLSDLPPGNYSLNIKTTSSDGIWSEPQTLMNIYIQPPFWKKWWFVGLLVMVAITVLIVAIYQISTYRQRKKIAQLKKQEALNNERNRIAKDLHDELGSGLSKIKFLSDLVLTDTDKTDQIKKLTSISETSANVVNNMKELIWLMNVENTSLDVWAASVREYAFDYLDEFDIHVRIEFPDPIPVIAVSKNNYRHLFMIVKESLQNIVKHSQATEVNIRLVITDHLSISLKDNGKGFDERKSEGNGLRNMRERSAIIKGTCKIESLQGKGTSIEVSVKMDDLQKD